MRQRFFITSTGTGIGKSFITASLVRQAKALSRSVMAYKPIISGFDPDDIAASDTGLLLQSLGLPTTAQYIDQISPWRYTEPLAPSMAARHEGRPIDFDALVTRNTTALAGSEDLIVIEGVGGVMVPLGDRHTVIDWIAALHIEAILVVGSYLGTISHTLTALAALQQRQIPIHAIIVNEQEPSSVPLADTVDELSRWTRLPIVAVAHRTTQDWQDVTELRALLV